MATQENNKKFSVTAAQLERLLLNPVFASILGAFSLQLSRVLPFMSSPERQEATFWLSLASLSGGLISMGINSIKKEIEDAKKSNIRS